MDILDILPDKYSLINLKTKDDFLYEIDDYNKPDEDLGGKEYYQYQYDDDSMNKFFFKFFPKTVKIDKRYNIVIEIHIQDQEGCIELEGAYDWVVLNYIIKTFKEKGFDIENLDFEELDNYVI